MYCFTIYDVVFASPILGCFPFSCPIPDFYADVPDFYTKIPYYSFSKCCTARAVREWGWYGVPWLAWRSSWPCTHFHAGVRFNPPTRFLIPDPSLAPFPTRDWGVKLRGSSVIRILWLRLQLDHLITPVLAKIVCPFFLPWMNSIMRVRPGLPSLALCPLKEQTAKIVSVGRDSA